MRASELFKQFAWIINLAAKNLSEPLKPFESWLGQSYALSKKQEKGKGKGKGGGEEEEPGEADDGRGGFLAAVLRSFEAVASQVGRADMDSVYESYHLFLLL